MGKVGGWIVWPVEDPSGPGGRRARTARTKHGRGPLAPAHALVLRAPWARKMPPPPGVTQRLPPPLRQRASASHTAIGWERRKGGADTAGAAAQRGSAPLRARGRAKPGSGRVGAAHPPPPPLRRVFRQRQKGNEKPGPTLYGAWHLTDRKKGQGPAPTPRAKPLPMPYGQRRLHPPAAGYRRKPTAPACARLSPSAQDLR